MSEEDRNVCNMNCNMQNQPEEQPNCNEKANMRRQMAEEIRNLDFAITELVLYLDTHPEDRKALCLHRKYCKECKELKDEYQKIYGPLTINYPCNRWRWLEQPWPWERGNY